MTKGTKIFRIVVCALLALTMIWSAIWGATLILLGKDLVLTAMYDIYVAGISVNTTNADDILGDGTVYYDAFNNILTFNNATIASENWPLYSKINLNIELIGKNRFVCKNQAYSAGVYAGDDYLSKDIAFIGDGSLTIEIPEQCEEAVGVFASNLTVTTDITVTTPDCENKVHGIVCDASLLVVDKAAVTVNNGAAKNSVGVRVRGNALLEEGTALHVAVNPGTTEICKGLSVSGDIFLGKDTSLEVLVDDSTTALGEGIRVSGLMEIGMDSTVTASAKNAYALECFGTIEAKKGSAISAVSDKKDADVFCSGAVVDCGAEFNAKIDALGGIHNKIENLKTDDSMMPKSK